MATPHLRRSTPNPDPVLTQTEILGDVVRMQAFRAALARTIVSGNRVIDLTGRIGGLACFAAECGARVICVEPNETLGNAARQLIDLNGHGDRVEVVQQDPNFYLPPEPIDIVLCNAFEVGLLRDRQVELVRGFLERYQLRFGSEEVLLIPSAYLLGVQLVQHSFEYENFVAPLPRLQDPYATESATSALSEVAAYYQGLGTDLQDWITWEGTVSLSQPGIFNALRFMTRATLASGSQNSNPIEWYPRSLIVPISEPAELTAGSQVRLRLAYNAGGSVDSLMQSLVVEVV